MTAETERAAIVAWLRKEFGNGIHGRYCTSRTHYQISGA